jgi:hypothetical protein
MEHEHPPFWRFSDLEALGQSAAQNDTVGNRYKRLLVIRATAAFRLAVNRLLVPDLCRAGEHRVTVKLG